MIGAAAKGRPLRATVVRAVETQYVAATMRLVDTAAEQAVLEEAIEASKPPVPEAYAHLHYLLSTPFRYSPLPWPSRFRAPLDSGVFYAAERDRTALAEIAHWRLKALLDAVSLRELEPAAHTLFKVAVAGPMADVERLLVGSEREDVLDPHDYGAAQQWGRHVRGAGLYGIRYPSVRDRPDGVCWAVFSPAAFRSAPTLAGEWFIRVTRDGVSCQSTRAAAPVIFFSAEQLQVS